MVRIPDKNNLKDHNWYSPRGVANFNGSAFAAPGRAVQELGSSIAKLGSSLGGAIEAGQAEQDGIAKHEATNMFLDAETRISDYINEQERNIAPDGKGHRDNINSFVEKTYREVFKSVPEKYRGQFDTQMHRRHQYYDLSARDYQQKKNDEYITTGINTGLASDLSKVDEKPDEIDQSIARGMLRIENSPLPRNRKDELIRNFGLEAERRHLQWRIKNADQTGESADDIELDIRQRIRPMWEPKLGPRSDAPQMNERGEPVRMAAAQSDSMVDFPGKPPETVSAVNDVATKIGVDPAAVGAVFTIESGPNWDKDTRTGSYRGVTQVGPETLKEMGVSVAQYEAMSQAEQAAFYGQWLEHYKFSDKIKSAGLDLKSMSPARQAAVLQAFQFAPNGDWIDRLKTGDVTSPVTRSKQARALGTTSIEDMERHFSRSGIGGGTATAATGGGGGGDLKGFLHGRLAPGYEKRTGDVDGLHDITQDRLGAFLKAAQDAGHDIRIVSGYRSKERQQVLWDNAVKKYGSAAAARKWVAPPGGSSHQSGEAVDLQYGDRKPGLGGKQTDAVKWAHANAEKYGLNFPLGHEDWHIEPIEARSGGKRYGGNYGDKRYWQGGTAVASNAPDDAPLPSRMVMAGELPPKDSDAYKQLALKHGGDEDKMRAEVGSETRDADTYGNARGTQVADASGAVPSSAISARIKSRLTDSPGMVQPGNIDLDNRPVIRNDDGSISTESSFSVAIDGKEILLPSIIDGKRVSQKDAIAHYRRTGEHLGVFDSPEAATAYAKSLSKSQDGAYSDGLAAIGSDGKIRTLLDGIPDQTPLSQLPADVRAEIEKLAPADAFKQRTVEGEPVAPADTITVGDVKNGLQAQLKAQAGVEVAQGAADKAVNEDRYGIAGRTPRYQYRWLTQPEADKLLRELSIAQRNKIMNQADGIKRDIAAFGERPELQAQEKQILERARKYMLPNQISKIVTGWTIEKETYRAKEALIDMPEDEVYQYMTDMRDRALKNTDPDMRTAYIKAYDAAEDHRKKIHEMRLKDPARAVSKSVEVMEVSQRIGQKMIESGYLSMGPDGKVAVNTEMRGSLVGREANEALVEARMEAQTRIFGSANDYRVRSITLDQAYALLNMKGTVGLSEDEVYSKLKEGAARADQMYGKYAAQVFGDAVKMVVSGKDNFEQANVIKDAIQGKPVSAEALHRYQLLHGMSGSEAFAVRAPEDRTSTQPYNYSLPVPSKYMSNGLHPDGGQQVPASGGLPAMLQSMQTMTQGTPTNAWPGNQHQQGQSVTTEVPTGSDITQLLSDPEKNGPAFTQKFGKQATDFILQEAQRRMQQDPNRFAPSNMLRRMFGSPPLDSRGN